MLPEKESDVAEKGCATLIHTEVSNICNQSQVDSYKKMWVEKYKNLEKIDRIEVDEEDNSALRLKFPPASRSGNYPVICEDVRKAYGSHVVFHDVNLTINRGEKVSFFAYL